MFRGLPSLAAFAAILPAFTAYAAPAYEISYDAEDILDSVNIHNLGSFPRAPGRDVSLDGTGDLLVFGAGGQFREILWRHPIRERVASTSGDSLVLEATVDWEIIGDPSFDGELVIMMSDGGRLMGASLGFDGGTSMDAAILHDECDFTDAYSNTFVPSDLKAIPLVMPITVTIEVGPTGSIVTAENGSGVDPAVSFSVPLTLDVTSDIEFLVGGREADTKFFALRTVDLELNVSDGPLVDKNTLPIDETCPGMLNNDPIALCQPIILSADPNTCEVCDVTLLKQMDGGSFDPDGEQVTINLFTPMCAPLGTHPMNMRVRDPGFAFDVCVAPVTVNDDTNPELVADGEDKEICGQGPAYVVFDSATATDTCSAMVNVTGSVTAIDGVPLGVPIPLDASHGAVVPAGDIELSWFAEDESGNVAGPVVEIITVAAGVNLATCCPEASVSIVGTNAQDAIVRQFGGDDHGVLALGGGDYVVLGSGDDCVLGGPGGDYIHVGTGTNQVWGGTGSDAIYCGYGAGPLQAAGESGADAIYASWCYGSDIRGGTGSDAIYGSSAGSDMIAPGSGADSVFADAGDDTVVLYDECEVNAGKTLDGGAGFDKLIIPVPLAQVEAAGVTVSGFEDIVVDGSQTALADCP